MGTKPTHLLLDITICLKFVLKNVLVKSHIFQYMQLNANLILNK